VTGTLLTRQRQTVATVLGERITAYDLKSQTVLAQLKAGDKVECGLYATAPAAASAGGVHYTVFTVAKH